MVLTLMPGEARSVLSTTVLSDAKCPGGGRLRYGASIFTSSVPCQSPAAGVDKVLMAPVTPTTRRFVCCSGMAGAPGPEQSFVT